MMSKTQESIELKEAHSATITTIIDNYIHIHLPASDRVERPPLTRNNVRLPPLLAEHGFSVLLEVFENSGPHTILMDFGISKLGVPNNLEVLEIDLDKKEEIEEILQEYGVESQGIVPL